jgi:hypothetical protein
MNKFKNHEQSLKSHEHNFKELWILFYIYEHFWKSCTNFQNSWIIFEIMIFLIIMNQF